MVEGWWREGREWMRDGLYARRGIERREEKIVRERVADTGFAWSVCLVGKTAGRGRSPASCYCQCIGVLSYTNTLLTCLCESAHK